MSDKDKKVVIITGDSSGIGKCLMELYSHDYFVYGISRKEEDHNNHYHGNVLDYDKLCKITSDIYNKHKHIDMLICSANTKRTTSTIETSVDNITYEIDVNLRGVINTNKAVLPYMEKQGYGKIINVCLNEENESSIYCATKAAVKAYSDALYLELNNEKIEVINYICDKDNLEQVKSLYEKNKV